jgi:1-deoxy-D-xylulose-5-phosphate reductoisomerase
VDRPVTRVAVLGSTGSIGCQTLDVIRAHPGRFEVVGLSAWNNLGLLAAQIAEFEPRFVSCAEPARLAHALGAATPSLSTLEEIATAPEVNIILSAVVGKQGLEPALQALRAGKTLALANKEAMVMAGPLLKQAASIGGGDLRPVDSEHSAIWQCLAGEDASSVRRLVLTASGGALRDLPLEALAEITPEEALAHPTWRMGRKITVDSATLFNKGLEVIEAHLLFDVPLDSIDVVMHRESIIHSMVEMRDGSIKAQLSSPDMRQPIQYALTYPERLPLELPALDLAALGALHFAPLEIERYPCLALALAAGRKGMTYPAAIAAADEEAVAAFLEGALRFTDIAHLLASALDAHQPGDETNLESILDADAWGRRFAVQWIKAHTWK